jgi:hypothetical protein
MKQMKLTTRVAKRVLPAMLAAAMASVCLPASIAFADTVTVTEITHAVPGAFTLTVPSVVAVDSNLDEAQIRAIFTGDFSKTAASLASLEAASITIPELKVVYDLTGEDGTKQTMEIFYKDIEMSDVSAGVAASSSVGSTIVNGSTGTTVTAGAVSTGLFNIAGLLGFYGLVSPGGASEMATVYEDFNFEGAELKSEEVTCEIGSVTMDEFKARPIKSSFAQFMTLAEEMGKDKPSPEAVKSFIGFSTDFLTAFESSPMEFSGFSCNGTDDKGKPVEISTGTVAVDGLKPGIYPQISIDDINIVAEGDSKVELGNFTSKAIDFNNAIAVVQNESGPIDEAWFQANYRKVIPGYEGFSISNAVIDVPDESAPGTRIQGSLGEFDLTLGDYRNGVPATISTSASDVTVTLPKDSAEDPVKSLVAMGFETLNMGFSLAAHWEEDNQAIVIDDLTTWADDLGTVTLTGTIGNAPPELFSDNLDAAMMAAMGLTVKDINIDLEDAGIAGIALASAAKEQGQDVEAFKTALSGMAQGAALAILGGTAEAKGVSEALGAFIAGAPILSIALAAKNPAGVGMADFMAIQADPTALAKVMTITATASGEAPAAPADEGKKISQ